MGDFRTKIIWKLKNFGLEFKLFCNSLGVKWKKFSFSYSNLEKLFENDITNSFKYIQTIFFRYPNGMDVETTVFIDFFWIINGFGKVLSISWGGEFFREFLKTYILGSKNGKKFLKLKGDCGISKIEIFDMDRLRIL